MFMLVCRRLRNVLICLLRLVIFTVEKNLQHEDKQQNIQSLYSRCDSLTVKAETINIHQVLSSLVAVATVQW